MLQFVRANRNHNCNISKYDSLVLRDIRDEKYHELLWVFTFVFWHLRMSENFLIFQETKWLSFCFLKDQFNILFVTIAMSGSDKSHC